jgi:hypothetical protein
MSIGGIPAQPQRIDNSSEAQAVPVPGPVSVPSPDQPQSGSSQSAKEEAGYVVLQRPPADADNPHRESCERSRQREDRFRERLKTGRARVAQSLRMGPAAGPTTPGLGHDVTDALQSVARGPHALLKSLAGVSPRAVGAVFAQVPAEQLAGCLNGLDTASESQKRDFVPRFLQTLASAKPAFSFPPEVLNRLTGSTLRALATHTGGGAGAQAFGQSGLLAELAGRAETTPRNAMAAMEALSQFEPQALPAAMKGAGLNGEALARWVELAGASDPMSPEGGWVNPETVGRLARKLAEQPGGRGLSSAVALTSSALAVRADKDLSVDGGLQKGLEQILQQAQHPDVPRSEKAAAAKALVDTGLFRSPEVLTPELRSHIASLIAGAGAEFTSLYIENSRARALSNEETARIGQMVRALGFSGFERARRDFNTMWGNLIGSTMRTAVDQKDPEGANHAGMLLRAFASGASSAQAEHDSKVQALKDLLGFAVSGIGGGFSWKLGDFNVVSPLKEAGKGLAADLANLAVGDGPQAAQWLAQLEDRLLDEAGTYADARGLSDSEWGELRRAFEIWR